jgi:hypothetical protein
MIQFENAKVYNFMGAIRNMRNSWQSWDKLDSLEYAFNAETIDNNVCHEANVEGFYLGEADKKLAQKLIKAGPDHAKFVRQIMLSVDITAGNELWKELDTYKVGTVANSTSMMHTAGKRLLTHADLSFDLPYSEAAERTLEHCNYLIQRWWDSGKKSGSPEWRDMQKGISMGFVYTRGFTCNYQVLQNIYHSRRNHRLSEWHEFARWIEKLPYSFLITGKETY